MVKKSRRKKLSLQRTALSGVDGPVLNFVDLPEKRFRARKINSINLKSMAESVSQQDEVPDDWLDRLDDDNDEISEGTAKLIITTSVQPMKNPTHVSSQEFNEYPQDFWHLLSKFIKPEEVGVFALICRQTYKISQSQSFWRHLYSKYFDPFEHSDLPVRLKSECMSRPKGLRAGVIKMLHMTYAPFLEKQAKESSLWPDPHLLTGRICLVNWSNKIAKKTVFFYFKLKDPNLKTNLTNCDQEYDISDDDEDIGDSQHTKKLIDDLSDIGHNPEEGCRILQVSGNCWSAIPPVIGLKLLGVTLSVSHGMRFHKLKLQFGSPLSDKMRNPDQNETTQVLIDNVCGMKVLDWWNPQYQVDGGERKTANYGYDQFGL